jgi:hypothetical protein
VSEEVTCERFLDEVLVDVCEDAESIYVNCTMWNLLN